MIASLREKKNTTTCTRLFNALRKLAGPDLFRKLFFVILTHGVSFDSLTQDDINLVCSHVASYTRGVLDNRTPCDVFVEKFGADGKAFLDKLGIVRIPGNEVTLDPMLLGAKFRRRADMVILKKNGVSKPKNAAPDAE